MSDYTAEQTYKATRLPVEEATTLTQLGFDGVAIENMCVCVLRRVQFRVFSSLLTH